VEFTRRTYRQRLCPSGMRAFTVTVKETDLWIAVEEKAMGEDLPRQVEQLLWRERRRLEQYIERDPQFLRSLEPYLVDMGAPPIALEMVRAGNSAGVGPMAAVAGAFAQYVGQHLLQFSPQVIVENGGDIFLQCSQPVRVGVFAGSSPFSGKLALLVKSRGKPLGVCTSSGTVGPSYSMGRADAAVIVAVSASLADAAATAVANKIKDPRELAAAVEFAGTIKGVKGALAILGDRLAAWGEVELLGL